MNTLQNETPDRRMFVAWRTCMICVLLALILPGCASTQMLHVKKKSKHPHTDPPETVPCPVCLGNHPLESVDLIQPVSGEKLSTMACQPLPIVEAIAPPLPQGSSDDHWAPRTVQVNPAEPPCAVRLQEARDEFDQKLARLEARFDDEREAHEQMQKTLNVVNSEVARLSREVDYWQREIQRIDQTTAAQHESDMEALRMISQIVDQITTNQTAATLSEPVNP